MVRGARDPEDDARHAPEASLRLKLQSFAGSLSDAERRIFDLVISGSADTEQVLSAWKATLDEVQQIVDQMTAAGMSSNGRYLVLQQKMQDESRRLSVLSNIMKTKHETAKNSISNLR